MSNEKACKNCGKQINADFKFCPYCEAKIEEQNFSESNSNEKVCKNCGKTIRSDFKVCPYCGNKLENQTVNENLNEKICKSCGKELEGDYKICPYCGVKIENEIQTEKPEKREENMRVCQFCGKQINADFKICPYCADKDARISRKSGVVCLLLLIFFFPLWAHRLYAGKIGSAFFRIILNFITVVLLVSPIAYFAEYASSEYKGYNFYYYNYENITRTEGVMGAFFFVGIVMALIIFIMLIIDLVFIIIGRFKDANGKYIKTNN